MHRVSRLRRLVALRRITDDEVRLAAYYRWKNSGEQGSPEAHWYAAKLQLKLRRRMQLDIDVLNQTSRTVRLTMELVRLFAIFEMIRDGKKDSPDA